MKGAVKVVLWALALPALMIGGCLAVDQISGAKARPPKSVVDIRSCVAWLQRPLGAYRVTVNGKIYYQITGPAGRFLASGPAAYTFDEKGHYVGWCADMGEVKRPPEVFQPGAKRERVSFDQLPTD